MTLNIITVTLNLGRSISPSKDKTIASRFPSLQMQLTFWVLASLVRAIRRVSATEAFMWVQS